MGLIKESDLKASDHIYVDRPPFGLYSHHGIYVGDGMVVHFSSAKDSHAVSGCRKDGNGVSKICLEEFLKNGKLKRYEYGVQAVAFAVMYRRGATTARSDPPEEVIRRAEYLLENGFGDYNLVSNNCEMFALYCKTGRVIQGLGSGQVATAASVPFSFSLFGAIIIRYNYDIGVRADAVTVEVEDLAQFRRLLTTRNTNTNNHI